MVNKRKISGQTVAIIILTILLLLSIVFGGVYAYYSMRSSKVTGKILMANLSIDLSSCEKSQIVISNGTNVVPNQLLQNSPLTITNHSSVPIYLMVVYELSATDENNNKIVDAGIKPVIDFGTDYINPSKNYRILTKDSDWVDYVFSTTESGKKIFYRCLVGTQIFQPSVDDGETITVIDENSMKLSYYMGNEYQKSSLSLVFQAYAIASDSLPEIRNSTREEKCNKIVSCIYEFQEYKFLNI